ncbi:MAG: hypothetical protein JWM27_334 [Gemmatimonadetes bacterium]|nr:hypothetical protein [Gemmatimonadota bacterium]
MIEPTAYLGAARLAITIARTGARYGGPPLRRANIMLQRGSRCFGIPRGRTSIVVPKTHDGEGELRRGDGDYQCASMIGDLFAGFGYKRGKVWEIRELTPPAVPSDEVLRENLFVVCGPAGNPLTQRVLADFPDLLHSVEFHRPNGGPGELHWRNHAFRSGDRTDFAVLAVKRNPYNPGSRVALLFGLRGIGTLAAGQVFADARHEALRRHIEKEFGAAGGDLECVLHVSHNADRSGVADVRVAGFADGEPLQRAAPQPVAPPIPAAAPPAGDSPAARPLQALYDWLKQQPRQLVVSQMEREMVVTRDWGLRMREEEDWHAHEAEIYARGKLYKGDADLPGMDGLRFDAVVTNGRGRLAVLPAEHRPHEKTFLLFPLPPVAPGAEAPRIRLTAEWPAGATRLRELNVRDDYRFIVTPHAARPVDQVKVRIAFDVPDARFRVVEQFQLPPGHVANGEYGIASPYEITLTAVTPGTRLAFAVERVQ